MSRLLNCIAPAKTSSRAASSNDETLKRQSITHAHLLLRAQLATAATMKLRNPASFVPMSVTYIIAVVYLAIIIPLIFVHETVPSEPHATLYHGLNLTEAWLDLAEVSNGFHPFNSRRNDDVRNWLLTRIEEILDSNHVHYLSADQLEGPQVRIDNA